jgi:ethanolamine utilization protein EutN
MVTGRVIGNVWATRRLEEVPAGAFLEVELEQSDGRIVAFDPLGSGIGERVLIARGSAARAWFGDGETARPIDALVIGSVDEPDNGNTNEE